jgi:hypothetical protein
LGTVVDILLEDVAQHVGVDVTVCRRQTVVEVPMPVVEEGKQALEGFIGNVNIGRKYFKFVFVEYAAIQIRYASVLLLEVSFMTQ